MAKLIFSMLMSLDGYVDHEAFIPDRVLFRHFIEEQKGLTGSLYGRKLYEIMQYWDADDPAWPEDYQAFAEAWRRQPKWVASRTLTSVGPNATLLTGDLETAVRALKSRHDGSIELGGPALAGQLTDLGLIDEYQIYLHPGVLGKGTPYFTGPRPPLRLVSHERIGESVIRLVYEPG